MGKTGMDFELENGASLDGAKENNDVEVDSDAPRDGVKQHHDPVMTGVDANHSADSPARDDLKDDVGSDVDQNDDTVMTGEDANHPAHSSVRNVTGGDANHPAGSHAQDDLKGEFESEAHRGEKRQQNSDGEQNHGNYSSAQGMSTTEADTIDSNSSGTDHSTLSPVQTDLKGQPETDVHAGNKSQPKSDENNSHDSRAQDMSTVEVNKTSINRSGNAKNDSAHHVEHGSKDSNRDQTNRSSLSRAENVSTTEQYEQ